MAPFRRGSICEFLMINEDRKQEILNAYKIPFEFERWLFNTAQIQFQYYCEAYGKGTASEEGFFSHLCSEFCVCWDNQKKREEFFK